jgi:hypothetical protein
MKKPNITEGEWVVQESVSSDWGKGIGVVAKQGVVTPVVHTMEDAKAISAVPEMIDALIEAYKAIDYLPDESLGISAVPDGEGDPQPYPIKYELMWLMQKALKKAGVEI